MTAAAVQPEDDQAVIDDFHRMAYSPAHQTTYLGLPLWKLPSDLFVYQELIFEVRPRLIIECGTTSGASALYFAHFMEKAGIDGRVVTIDLSAGDSFEGFYVAGRFNRLPAPIKLPRHERITYLRGMSSVEPAVHEWVFDRAADSDGPVMVILDSEHSKDHVLAEMDAYSGLVSPGSYMVVEDTNVNGHPVFVEHGPGPFEAVEEWLPGHPDFERTRPYEKYLMSFHHAGWLRRRQAP